MSPTLPFKTKDFRDGGRGTDTLFVKTIWHGIQRTHEHGGLHLLLHPVYSVPNQYLPFLPSSKNERDGTEPFL